MTREGVRVPRTRREDERGLNEILSSITSWPKPSRAEKAQSHRSHAKPPPRTRRCGGPPRDRKHPYKEVPRAAFDAAEREPGIWIVTTERGGKQHHAIIAVCSCGDKATHGGVEGHNPHRAIRWANVHADRYGMRLVTKAASAEIQQRVAAGDKGHL